MRVPLPGHAPPPDRTPPPPPEDGSFYVSMEEEVEAWKRYNDVDAGEAHAESRWRHVCTIPLPVPATELSDERPHYGEDDRARGAAELRAARTDEGDEGEGGLDASEHEALMAQRVAFMASRVEAMASKDELARVITQPPS